MARAASAGATIATRPMPQLNTRCISASATPPTRCSQSNSAGRGQARPSMTARVPLGSTRDVTEAAALAEPNVVRGLGGKAPRRVIVVPDKIVNLVV